MDFYWYIFEPVFDFTCSIIFIGYFFHWIILMSESGIHSYYKRASSWATFWMVTSLKGVAFLFDIYFLLVPLIYVGICMNPNGCILFYGFGPCVWIGTCFQLCGLVLSFIHPIPGLVLNFMASFGFLCLAPILWYVGSYSPVDPLTITSAFISLAFSVLCFIIGLCDTIEVFKMWMGKNEIQAQIQDETHQTLLSQDDHDQ